MLIYIYRTLTLLFTGIVVSCLWSCRESKLPSHIADIIDRSGNNSDALKSVIRHYSKEPKDSLKLKAAYFIIENIEGMYTLDTASTEGNEIYFNLLKASWHTDGRIMYSRVTKAIDSVNNKLNIVPSNPPIRYLSEMHTIMSEFIIDNIEDAFYVWENMPWAKSISFEDFCEYILPYRCTDTYSVDARNFFLERYKHLQDSVPDSSNPFEAGDVIVRDVNYWFKEDVDLLYKFPYLRPIKFSDLLKGKMGPCIDANSVRVTALRSMGVPAALDQTPTWGNSNSAHFWYRIVDPQHDTITALITNENVNRKTQHIISATSFDAVHSTGAPPDAQVMFIRTIPKVFRKTFSKQKDNLAMIKTKEDTVPDFFANPRLKDVTEEYVITTDVSIRLNDSLPDQKFVYLCTFNNAEWKPAAWAVIKDGRATFTKIGKNVVYLPAYYYRGNFVPAGYPFLLALDGKMEELIPGKDMEEVSLRMKFPLRTYVLDYAGLMLGARFQVANKPDFSDSVTLHTIKTLPFYRTEVNVGTTKPYRYLIYQFRGLPKVYVSEVQFYGKDTNGKEVKLAGKVIGNPGVYPYLADKINNDVWHDLFKAKEESETYIGIDLGEENATHVTKIKFMPFSDDNAVIAGDYYEMWYWKNAWISMGLKKATPQGYVIYDNVPEGALLLLRHSEGGWQQRVFVYKDGKQEFF